MIDDLPSPLRRLVDRGATLVHPPRATTSTRLSVEELATEALERPIGAPRLRDVASSSSRVVVVVSDATRDEPRMPMFRAIRRELAHLPDSRIDLAIASGTHAPRPPSTVIDADVLARHRVIVHDGSDLDATVDLGATAAGTRVRVNRDVASADVIVSTGRIRPHYFAGFSGGAKGIFPGCGYGPDIRQNHLFKAESSARLGRLDDNVCRVDMEAAARLVPAATYLLNVVADVDGAYVFAAAGDLVEAHRAACERAAPLFVANGPKARVVVTSDVSPVTDSLYQASKLLPPAGAVLVEGGVAIVVAQCPEGIGPLKVVNEGIYELGVRHHLPPRHAVRLVSSMSPEVVATSYARYAESVDAALVDAGLSSSLEGVTLLWRAGEMIARALP